MLGIVALGAASVALLRQTREAQQIQTQAPDSVAYDQERLEDIIIDPKLIQRNWSSYGGPVKPYHFGPSSLINESPMSLDQIKALSKSGWNQIPITIRNQANTFDPFTLPSVNDRVVAATPAAANEPDSFQVMRNTPIEGGVGDSRFPRTSY